MQKILLILHLLLVLASPASLQVTNQAHIVMEDSTYLVLNGNFKNNGTFKQKAGTVKFTGISPTITGTDTPGFFRMQLAMPAASVLTLGMDIKVAKAILFGSGLIDLNTRNITLSDTGLLVEESETSRITGPNGGFVQITRSLYKPSNINPGNLGATLTHPVNFGNMTIRRGHQSHPIGSYGKSIFRFFQITPTDSLSGARLRINYLNAELNGLNPYCLIPFKSMDRFAWAFELPVSRDVTLKYVEKWGISPFPFWTLSVQQPSSGGACFGARQAAELTVEKSMPGNEFIKRIYPTVGVKNSFYVETGHLPVQTIQVMLYDAKGNLLLNKQITYQSQWLPIPAVSAGVYQVKILSAEKFWQGKLIKD